MEEVIALAEYLVKGIVKDPEMVKVQQFDDEEETIILEIIVHSEDMGQVIGKGGKMINSIRTLIQAAAYNRGLNRIKINVDSF